MQNDGVRKAHKLNDFRRKYHNFAFCILHFALPRAKLQIPASSQPISRFLRILRMVSRYTATDTTGPTKSEMVSA